MRSPLPLPFSNSVTAGMSRPPSPVKATMASAVATEPEAAAAIGQKPAKPMPTRKAGQHVAKQQVKPRRGRFDHSQAYCCASSPSRRPIHPYRS